MTGAGSGAARGGRGTPRRRRCASRTTWRSRRPTARSTGGGRGRRRRTAANRARAS